METRQEYLIRFLRGCASAADAKQLGVVNGRLLLNGDLMREAAEEFEKLLPETFKDPTDELHYNMVRAEQHARQAHDLLYLENGPKRSIWYKSALGRAQSILMTLWKRELRWKS